MEIKVSNLELFSVPFGISVLWNLIFQAKINLIDKLSKQYENAHFVFSNILGEFGMYDKVNEILSAYFNNYSITDEELDFNSSPINNIPIIQIDNEKQKFETETIGIFYPSDLSNLPEKKYSKNIIVLKQIVDQKKYEKLSEDYIVIGDFEKLEYKNLLERKVTDLTQDDTTKSFLLKVLRGDKVC
ncbi:hypothetical protein HNP65_001064 [Thermosipho japonicus]|uniref:Uncharacterized protein n=1 Tax=Thermosipho japonicus TaxID=90323 RepID=A0A841GG56_9BACT|nr:hypothetical protein [Thermosipho japonicus]MBB6062626.1 hypothetical protein [Thermosipho japonicus]